MNETPKAVVELLTLPEEDYYAFDDARTVEFQRRLSKPGADKKPPPGVRPVVPGLLAIGAPRLVDLTSRTTIPVLVAARWSQQRQWEVLYDRNACIFVVDLRTGTTTIGRPFLAGKREKTPPTSRAGSPPDAKQATTISKSVRRFDLRQIARMNWETTRVAVTATVYDWTSNTVIVELKDPGKVPEATQPAPRAASPFLDPNSLGKPPPPGLILTVPATAAVTGPIAIQGSVRLLEQNAVVLPAAPPETSRPEADTPPPKTAKLVTATVILLKLDDRVPVLVDLAIPTSPLADPGSVGGTFGFDLLKVTTEPLSGLYQVYLVAGTAIAGPYPLTIGEP